MNYFDTKKVAERYSKGRPAFHRHTIRHIANCLHLDKKLGNALDVACGTGFSSRALLEIAAHVYGTDLSPEMLRLARRDDRINYTVAPAEKQPFKDNFFDLITVSSGVHWFDIDRFLEEANRLLKSKAWLVLYENHFIAEMEGNENFSAWFPDVYLKKFPSPPRNNNYNWTGENLVPKNLIFAAEEKFKNPVAMSRKQLVLYFTTQSNIIAQVENKQTSYTQVENWLNRELYLFFENDDSFRTINFGNWVKYIQRAN